MAKTSMIYRDLKRKRLAEKYRTKREELKKIISSVSSYVNVIVAVRLAVHTVIYVNSDCPELNCVSI